MLNLTAIDLQLYKIFEITGVSFSGTQSIIIITFFRRLLSLRSQMVALRDGDVHLFVCSFVRLSPVKFVKSFARWQHLAAGRACYYEYDSLYCDRPCLDVVGWLHGHIRELSLNETLRRRHTVY